MFHISEICWSRIVNLYDLFSRYLTLSLSSLSFSLSLSLSLFLSLFSTHGYFLCVNISHLVSHKSVDFWLPNLLQSNPILFYFLYDFMRDTLYFSCFLIHILTRALIHPLQFPVPGCLPGRWDNALEKERADDKDRLYSGNCSDELGLC